MNREELRAAIARKNITKTDLAEALGITRVALQNKMSGSSEFKESEIKTLVRVLGLTAEEFNHIFLA